MEKLERFSKSIRGFVNGIIAVQIFTDGSCFPNPGRFGGWSYIIMFNDGRPQVKCSGGYDGIATNNRLELTAAIEGISSLKKPTVIELVTDSEYLGRGISFWMTSWKSGGFRNKNGDLWKQIYSLCQFHNVYVTCIRGHSGQPENEECDRLASQARERISADKV
jgi:ribonuclease HI